MEKNTTALMAPVATLRLVILFAGPLASWQLAQATFADQLAPGEINFVALVLALIWSPLFFSIPALLMHRDRDRLVPSAGGLVASLVRGVRLVPTMFRHESGIRTETFASIVGWTALLIASAPQLGAALVALF